MGRNIYLDVSLPKTVSGPAAPVDGTGGITSHFGRWSSDEEILGQGEREDVDVQTDGDTEIEDLRRKNETLAKELVNKQAVIEAHENEFADYYQSILELKAELKIAQKKNDAHIQMQSGLMREKEAVKRELEGKVTLVEENTMKMVQLNEELEKAKKEIEAYDELKSILMAENKDLKESNEERSFVNEELALEKIKLEKELMEARSNDQKRSQGHQRLKELQKRDLEKVKKEEGTGDEGSPGKEKCGLDKTSVVEGCETPAEDDKKVVIVKEENKEKEKDPQENF
ncbi:moesin-like [Palaemon carinicauda]|uniref:moesin-like n=1 Tax=Palaemon carinicauda TaxID=392227 RepID=UPI0035B5C8D1